MPTDYEKLRNDNIREYGEGTRHLSFLGRLYTDRTHFVFELLQNAEDAGATRILFSLFADRLEVTHDGRFFNELDVKGVCGVGEGTKAEDLTQIGKFGIGFKSVYAYTTTPEVYSGEEGFKIKNYVRPYAISPKSTGNSWTTLFVFPFNTDQIGPETACQEIGARLRNLSARTLLFLRGIKEIEYKLLDETNGVYLREEKPRASCRQVTVIGQNEEIDVDENWLIFERPVFVPGGGINETVPVEVGFRLESEAKVGRDSEHIIKVKESPLVVFFPTEKETRFGFLIQGPYKTTPSRDNIPKDDEWNKALVRETAELVGETLSKIKGLGLLSVSFLETLPIRTEDFTNDSMFSPIVEAVRKTLVKEELLPADDGSFVSAGNSKLARSADLRKLLSQVQLGQLFQSSSTLKWLAKEITQDRTPALHNYLIDELEVEELTPDGFARKVGEAFLSNQTDDWITSFYRFIGNQKSLWKPGGEHYWNSPGPLRVKPIVRLNDGKHVKPYRDDGSPNVYILSDDNTETTLPFVKTAITGDEDALKFLKDLGIPELDHVAEVIEKILPKYEKDSPVITCEKHLHDIIAIEKAYATDSQEMKNRLHGCLLKTPFIRKERQNTESPGFDYPENLYFNNDDLRLYFSENESIAFVWSEYSQSTIDFLKSLGVSDSVRVSRKSPNRQGFVIINNSHGYHKRGINGFDPEIKIEGLNEAMATLTPEKSLFIWNNIAIPFVDCIRGTIETSSRQTYENSSKVDEISEFGKLLIEAEWLPDTNNNFNKPCNIELDKLPDSFIRNDKLAHKLGLKLDVADKLAKEIGLKPEILEYAKNNPHEIERLIAKDAALPARKEGPTFPTRSVANPERRQERLGEQLSDAPNKEYEKRERNVRTTSGTIDPIKWLRNQYTNEVGQMVCQICKEEMPFRKRDGKHYFEKKEVLSRKHLPREHEAQYLALCPLCAAKYEEFVKNDDEVIVKLKQAIVNSENCEVPITLGNYETSIRFVETHHHDLKMIIEGLG